jgi:hypothetical protein
MKRLLTLITLMFAVVVFTSACYAGPRVYFVRKPPPARVEVIGVAPSSNHVWISGHWAWKGGAYHWQKGYWMKRPRANVKWIPGHWKYTRHGYVWKAGHWR